MAERRNCYRIEVVEVYGIGFQKLEILAEDLDERAKSNSASDSRIKTKKVHLEGVWVQNRISKHTIIHLINPLYDESTDIYLVNNSIGFAVVEPDNLLTCTLVASSLFCERKTWLNSVFLGQVGTNRAMLVGTLVHEVFQYGVKNRVADVDKLIKYLDELLDDATVMLEIYSVEIHLNEVRDEAISYFSSVKEWIDKYLFSGPRHPLTNEPDLEVKVMAVTDIEENVWSTKYGLKGKIDVTGAIRIYDRKSKSLVDKTIPLELKTGNPNLSSSHAAQVSLYSMMIEDRYSETNQGFVIYLKNKAAMYNVALTHNIKRDLIQRRNQINYHMKSYYHGPDMIDQSRMCKNCERQTECVLMSNLYEPGRINEFTVMKSLEAEATGHLDDRFKTFFKKYHEKLVASMGATACVPGSDSKNGAPKQTTTGSFWTYSSEQAEASGSGFSKLQATATKDKQDNSFITFKRHPHHCNKQSSRDKSPRSKNGNALVVDEVDGMKSPRPVIKKMRIEDFFKPVKKTLNGCVIEQPSSVKPFNTQLNYNRCRLAISLDNDSQTMDSQNSSTAIAIGFMNELKENYFVMKLYEGAIDLKDPSLVYRVDKLEKRSPIEIERVVLVRLLAREDWRCDRVRQLILDTEYVPQDNTQMNLFVLSRCFDEISRLGAEQQKFVVKAVATDNYCVLSEQAEPNRANVHKTLSVFSEIVTGLDRSLLIVAQNVDHLVDLMQVLQQKKIRFILLDDGKSTKARYRFAANLVKVPQIENFALSKKYEAYIRQHEQALVVITSYAMSIGGLLFTRRTFNYCVAYDAHCTELLVGLSPMFCSDRHIIIDIRAAGEASGCGGGDDVVTLGEHLRCLRRDQGAGCNIVAGTSEYTTG